MKKIIKHIAIAASVLALAACTTPHKSSSRGSGGASGDFGADNGALAGQGLAGMNSFDGQNTGGKSQQELLAIHTYHFAFNSSSVSDEDKPAVIAQAHYLASNPNKHVLLAGNTDNRGSREYNIALGWRRAQSVEDLMLVNGASKDQIKMVSYGEEKPVAMGDTEEAYEKNRRVDLSYEN